MIPVEQTTPLGAAGDATGPRGRDATGPLPARVAAHVAVVQGGSIRRSGSDLAAGTLTQLFDVQVEGHESYWFVTRPQASLAPNIRAFRDWLFSEIDAENR